MRHDEDNDIVVEYARKEEEEGEDQGAEDKEERQAEGEKPKQNSWRRHGKDKEMEEEEAKEMGIEKKQSRSRS